jgi:hypothetical protein
MAWRTLLLLLAVVLASSQTPIEAEETDILDSALMDKDLDGFVKFE